jgi:hypothetical protein
LGFCYTEITAFGFGLYFLAKVLRDDLRRAAGKEEVMCIKNTLSGLGKLLLFSALLAATFGCAGNGVTGKAEDVKPTVPPITPTVVPETGSGELFLKLQRNVYGANRSVVRLSAEGAIPFTIHSQPNTKLWDIQGEGKADNTAKFEDKEAGCTAESKWTLDYYVAGVLVPAGGLPADKGQGCYMLIKITQAWHEEIGAVASCPRGKGPVMLVGAHEETYGPYKFPIMEGAPANDKSILEINGLDWVYQFKVRKLDVPLQTGCMEGEVIIVPSK